MIRDPATADLVTPGRLETLASRWAAARGASTALSDPRGEWSWRDLEHGRKQLAELLLTLGVRSGDRVMVVGDNCASLVALTFAISSVHAWAVVVNARLCPRELDALRAHCTPRRTLFLGDDSPDARLHAERLKATRLSLGRWGTISVSPMDERCVPEVNEGNAGRDVAALVYSGSAADAPRGVMLTHANLMFVARVLAEERGFVPQDRVHATLPLSHCAGLVIALAALRAGARLRLSGRFSPAGLAEELGSQAITVCHATPGMYGKLASEVRSRSNGLRHALRFACSLGPGLDEGLKGRFEELLGVPLAHAYGVPQVSSCALQTPHGEARSDRAVGRPLPGTAARIVDAAGNPVEPGLVGELQVRGPGVMKGFYRDAARTSASLAGGWVATGDLARQCTRDGAYFIEDRAIFPANVT
jgi:acyl-CoA synthetase (AMP-forming)/AMP-acid ligase II